MSLVLLLFHTLHTLTPVAGKHCVFYQHVQLLLVPPHYTHSSLLLLRPNTLVPFLRLLLRNVYNRITLLQCCVRTTQRLIHLLFIMRTDRVQLRVLQSRDNRAKLVPQQCQLTFILYNDTVSDASVVLFDSEFQLDGIRVQ